MNLVRVMLLRLNLSCLKSFDITFSNVFSSMYFYLVITHILLTIVETSRIRLDNTIDYFEQIRNSNTNIYEPQIYKDTENIIL